ncbi:hypothetical protein Trydic_g8142 [Trypoxylus dichotomus]
MVEYAGTIVITATSASRPAGPNPPPISAGKSEPRLHGYRVYLNQPQLTALVPDKSTDAGKLIDCTEWIHKSIFASRFAHPSFPPFEFWMDLDFV